MNLPFRKPGAELVYFILSGASALSSAIMFTVYTVYYVAAVGLNPLQLVLVGTMLELTCFVFEVPTGVVADTYSRRLSVILGMFFLGAAFMLVGAIPLFAVVLLGQVVSGIGYTFLSGATDAWLADEVGEANVGRVYLRSGQISRIAGLVGIVASVGLASIRLNLPYLFGGALYIALGVFLILVMPERGFSRAPTRPASRAGTQRETGKPAPRAAQVVAAWQTMGSTLRAGAQVVRGRPILLMLLMVGLFYGASSEGFDRLGDAHLLANFTFPALGALKPVVWFGILNVAGSLTCLIVTELFRQRLEVASRNPVATARALMAFNLLSVASVVAFGLVGNFPLAFAALLVKAVAGSLSDPLYTAWLVQNINPKVRATVLSMMSQSNALGQIAGGPVIGAVGMVASLRAAIVLTGTLLSPIGLLYARALRQAELDSRPAEAQAVEHL